MVNPLQTTLLHPGIVSVRVIFVLRSTEVFPVFLWFVLPCYFQKINLVTVLWLCLDRWGNFFQFFFFKKLNFVVVDLSPFIRHIYLRLSYQTRLCLNVFNLICYNYYKAVFAQHRNTINFKNNGSTSTVLEQDHFYSDFLLSQTTVSTNFNHFEDEARHLVDRNEYSRLWRAVLVTSFYYHGCSTEKRYNFLRHSSGKLLSLTHWLH